MLPISEDPPREHGQLRISSCFPLVTLVSGIYLWRPGVCQYTPAPFRSHHFLENLSSLVKNVPMLTSLRMSPFCVFLWSRCRPTGGRSGLQLQRLGFPFKERCNDPRSLPSIFSR